MEPCCYRVYLCTQGKPDNAPCCPARGSQAALEPLRAELRKARLGDEAQVTTSGSIGPCERGPSMVVYPEGMWYSGVPVVDIPEIVREHFVNGRPVARVVNRDPAATNACSAAAEHAGRVMPAPSRDLRLTGGPTARARTAGVGVGRARRTAPEKQIPITSYHPS